MGTKINHNYEALGEQMTPRLLRKPRMLAWVRVILSQLNWLKDQFVVWAVAIGQELKWNGQVIVLERALSRRYLNADVGVIVDNTATRLPRWLGWYRSEGQPALGTGWHKSETQPELGFGYWRTEYAGEVDFIVKFPVAYIYNESEVRAYLSRYVICGKRYTITTY